MLKDNGISLKEDERWCPKCEKPRKVGTEFSLQQAWCKPCLAEKARSYYNYEKMRDRQLRQNYPGFDIIQYQAMFGAQGGVCAVCGKPEVVRPGRTKRSDNIQPTLAVDHCHKTHKVRALLCHPCNQAFGALEESPQRIKLLLAYAEKHTQY